MLRAKRLKRPVRYFYHLARGCPRMRPLPGPWQYYAPAILPPPYCPDTRIKTQKKRLGGCCSRCPMEKKQNRLLALAVLTPVFL